MIDDDTAYEYAREAEVDEAYAEYRDAADREAELLWRQ